MALADYVKGLREGSSVSKKPTLEDVSGGTGISVTTLSQIENGHIKSPSVSTLNELAKYYGRPVQEFIDMIVE